MITSTDEQLALGIQAGKEQDLVALLERHYSALIGYLYRFYGGDRELAQDTAQDVVLQITRAIDQYQYPRAFKPWLYAIATNMARNYYRRADTRHTVALDESELGAIPHSEDMLARGEDEHYLAQILAALPEHQREVILLRYYEDLSLEEIAMALNIPVGTVKSRLSLSLKKLRAMTEAETP